MDSRRRFDERGQALVEFALVLPLLLLVVWGIVDFGRALGWKDDLTHLANQGSRSAAVNACVNCGGVTLNQYLINLTPTSDMQAHTTVAISFSDAGGKFPGDTGYTSPAPHNHCVGAPVRVSMQYPFGVITHLWGSVTLHSSSVMRLEKNWGSSAGAYQPGVDAYTATGASADSCP
jgi:Flp pilus assembly protein TadG